MIAYYIRRSLKGWEVHGRAGIVMRAGRDKCVAECDRLNTEASKKAAKMERLRMQVQMALLYKADEIKDLNRQRRNRQRRGGHVTIVPHNLRNIEHDSRGHNPIAAMLAQRGEQVVA
jgi:hypothetical protein